jgi:hypothetical protein
VRPVLEKAIIQGAASRDFFGTAFGQSGENFEGFKFGDKNVQLDDTLLLIAPEAAKQYKAGHIPPPPPIHGPGGDQIRLSKVFRYTPQIADFLYDLDATFPAIDLTGEWEEYAATAEVA